MKMKVWLILWRLKQTVFALIMSSLMQFPIALAAPFFVPFALLSVLPTQEAKGQVFMPPKGDIKIFESQDNTEAARTYNMLTTVQERNDTIDARIQRDFTKNIQRRSPPLYSYTWNCNHAMKQVLVNTHDWGENVYDGNLLYNGYKGGDLELIYINGGTLKDAGAYGLPTLDISLYDSITVSQGHAMNAILTADSIPGLDGKPFKLENYFNIIEPGFGVTDIKPDGYYFPKNCEHVQIYYAYTFKNQEHEKNFWTWKMLEYKVTDGIATLTYNINEDTELTYNIDNLDVDPRLYIPINERMHLQETRIKTGINNIVNESDDIKIYPNLAREYINIESNINKPVTLNIEIYDMLGRLIDNYNENVYGQFKDRKDISKLKTGMYIIKTQKHYNDGKIEIETDKFVKEIILN
jgi:hypothetical protein